MRIRLLVMVATYDVENNAFEDGGGDLEGTNNPIPGASQGDYTAAAEYFEFDGESSSLCSRENAGCRTLDPTNGK